MSEDKHLLTEAQIQAYVDNQLNNEERQRVEAVLAINPELMFRVMQYTRLNKALALNYASMQEESVPSHVIESLYRSGHSMRLMRTIAASLLIFVTGLSTGWLVFNPPSTHSDEFTHLLRPAYAAHVMYTREVLHPVEVRAENEQHLVKWLSKRLHGEVITPRLHELGFRLMGGRLLPDQISPAAQFMYEDDNGHRLTLYLRKEIKGNRETAFRYAEQNGTSTFYWVDQNFAYALTGDISHDQLLRAATVVYTRYNSDE